ncbi:hypothetical protein [Arthrobacter sp. CJ23]|uniref:hypothetical protein n=1 Tax=Arthrobacter sp. CJ23 TaxID=2972479 RepID=UPI00215D54D3|nr:hypothetical protein [Arthrobacter sp. CJ23]UVJ37980.1 hypothetical protein NVV90_11955 [Arthrobacter sp. CJ23]
MSEIHAYGELLTASAEDRTLTYKLLPFGEEGFTSVGKIIASKGSVTIPEDVNSLELNEEHDFKKQIGKFVRVEETDSGIEATVRIVNTTKGNDALTLAAEGLRTGISVEIANPIIRDGKLTAGQLTGAGLVVRPAFKNAQLVAADFGNLTPEKETHMETNSETLEATEAVSVVQAAPVFAASANYPGDFAQTLLAAARGENGPLTAALAEVHTDFDPAKIYLKDQDLGTLWNARRVSRPIAERFLKGAVTSLTLTGTRRTRVTQVADWAGNRVELPTSPGFTTTREWWGPVAKAVALGLSAEIVAFGDASVISDIYADALDSYYTQTEAIVVDRVLSDSPAVTATTGAIAAVNKAADTMNAIGANLDFVLVSPDVHAAIRDIPAANAPWWLQNQGKLSISNGTISFEGGPIIVSSAALPIKTVIAGDARAIDFRESKDFRHGAHNLPVFGEDISLVKFYALKTLDAGALIKFTNVTGA